MRWQPDLMSRLARVRDMRLRLAEMAVSKADQALQVSRDAERDAQHALTQAAMKQQLDIAQADEVLLSGQRGGRHGISDWQVERKRAQRMLQKAQGSAGDAASARLDRELACSAARREWRDKRLDVERLRLLVDVSREPFA